jgi:hypothetical protein
VPAERLDLNAGGPRLALSFRKPVGCLHEIGKRKVKLDAPTPQVNCRRASLKLGVRQKLANLSQACLQVLDAPPPVLHARLEPLPAGSRRVAHDKLKVLLARRVYGVSPGNAPRLNHDRASLPQLYVQSMVDMTRNLRGSGRPGQAAAARSLRLIEQ